MPPSVAGQECDFFARQSPDHINIGWRAEGGGDCEFLLRLEFRHGIQAAAADDTDARPLVQTRRALLAAPFDRRGLFLEQLARDDHALDLAGAFADSA